MFYNIKITIAYSGVHFAGWQRQSSKRTVQGEIENALSNLFRQDIKIDGAGRTDAGVHAYGQVATFNVDTTMPFDRFYTLINRRMPEDISITDVEIVDNSFHARYSSKAKRYAYKIYHGVNKNPIYSDFYLYNKQKLNVDVMKLAANFLIGKKDFKSFMASGSSIKNTIREIYSIDFFEDNEFLTIEFYGDGFLYNMVRIMVGLMLDVESGKIKLKDILQIIESKDRNLLKNTARANGLYLMEVYY